MRYLPFFRQSKLKPTWEYRVEGVIWRLLCSSDNRIVGEDRDQRLKSVSFFCLEAQSGEPLWEGLRLDESWWISIELIQDGVLFINEFIKPDLPEQGKIHAIDVETGKLLWTNSELNMLFVAGGRVYASRALFDRHLYFALDLKTGQLVSEFGSDARQIDHFRVEERSTTEEGLIFPEGLTEQSQDYALVRPIVAGQCKQEDLRGPVEYIHSSKHILISFHETSPTVPSLIGSHKKIHDGRVDNRFFIVDADSQKVLFEETLNHAVSNPVPDSFFMKNDVVYFIREKEHLVAIRLRP